MKQISVDSPDVQASLGDMQMRFLRKAEEQNSDRADEYIKSRRQTAFIGISCISLAIGVYFYTIYAIKQEKFLDDFDMPDPMLPVTEQK